MIVVRRIRPRPRQHRQSDIDATYLAMMGASTAAEKNRRSVWRPPIEVYETDDSLEIVAEIAGMSPEDIDIVLEGDVLTIQGDRKDSCERPHRSYHLARIGYGAFGVEIQLPFQVDADGIEANYDNGFLRISLMRAQATTIVPTSVPARSVNRRGDSDDNER